MRGTVGDLFLTWVFILSTLTLRCILEVETRTSTQRPQGPIFAICNASTCHVMLLILGARLALLQWQRWDSRIQSHAILLKMKKRLFQRWRAPACEDCIESYTLYGAYGFFCQDCDVYFLFWGAHSLCFELFRVDKHCYTLLPYGFGKLKVQTNPRGSL